MKYFYAIIALLSLANVADALFIFSTCTYHEAEEIEQGPANDYEEDYRRELRDERYKAKILTTIAHRHSEELLTVLSEIKQYVPRATFQNFINIGLYRLVEYGRHPNRVTTKSPFYQIQCARDEKEFSIAHTLLAEKAIVTKEIIYNAEDTCSDKLFELLSKQIAKQ